MTHDAFDADRWATRLVRDTEGAHRYDGETGTAFTEWQRQFRNDLRTVLGLYVVERTARVTPNPHRHEVDVVDDHERQRWSLRTEPDWRLPFSIMLPADAEPPFPVVLTVHGHTDFGTDVSMGVAATEDARRQIAVERRDIARQAVDNGFAAVVPAVRGFGALEATGPRWEGERSCTALQHVAQLFGRTLAGDRVWDILRVLDFVADAPQFDSDRIGITGHSGGGAVALFASALDERLSVASVNSYLCAVEQSIVGIDHCACNYVPGLATLGDLPDIAGLVAPRPLVVTAGRDDSIFPIKGVRVAFDRVQTMYDAVGRTEDCTLFVGDGGHRYYPDGVWPFFDKRL
ncbi:alpha/beta hydrolase family protein [Haloarchaeobius sp. DFWS5]|uniref:alpha/beta hydrolase family protein n=1 Tax=Haloarchaeobius sp. DFWS5 TaxID=3446114 RepID=UPI003EBE8EB9